jgi:hypothetical protein
MTPTLLAGVLVLAAGAPGLKDKPRPEPTLVGEWAAASVTVGGRPVPSGSDRWVFRAEGTYALYARGEPADAGDLTGEFGKAEGAVDLASKTVGLPANLCRFRIDGDTLALAVGQNRGGRPAGLDPGPRVTVWVFKRVHDK